MKTIKTEGITYLKPVNGATSRWYYGLDQSQGDLYEAEEIFKAGKPVKTRKLCLVHYPEGTVYFPIPEKEGQYCEEPVFFEDSIYILNVDFCAGKIQILKFDCTSFKTDIYKELSLSCVKDCYNLKLNISPLTLTRQCVLNNEFEIIWPERISFKMDDHDSFFLRDADRLIFNRWHEEGEGDDYIYFEETVIRDLSGNVIETYKGDMMLMPNGEIWHIS